MKDGKISGNTLTGMTRVPLILFVNCNTCCETDVAMHGWLSLCLNLVLIEFYVFHHDAQVLVRIGDQIDVLEWIAVDEQ